MTDIDVLLSESRRFPPPADFPADAQVRDRTLHAAAAADDVAYWADQASTLQWQRPWDTALEWTPPHARWFTGGQLNVSENCLDRHLA
ncbi:MAG: acetyl-coenzyme A synthetase N-terminal domain-containing protein, partial [Gemmatimonadota bacterium]